MTHPHAAGALVSSVDDLAIWDAALYTDKLVKQSTLQRAFVPYWECNIAAGQCLLPKRSSQQRRK